MVAVPKSILIYAPQMAVYGGMERHLLLVARAAAAAGHRVALWTTSNSLAEPERVALRAAGVDFRELAVARGQAGAARKLAWLLAQVARSRWRRQRWHTVYTNGQSGLARYVWGAATAGTRILHHHHTAADAAEQATWSPAFRQVLHRAPQLVACSLFTARQLSAALGRDDVVTLPYLTPELLPAGAVSDHRPEPDRPLVFGFLGRLVSSKGIDTLLALSQRPELADLRWELHGSGPAAPADLTAYPNVTLHPPYATATDQASRLARLDAVALFTRHCEGQPLSLTEAMAAGLPWIATDKGGTAELARAPENCVLLPADASVEVAAKGVRQLADRIKGAKTSRKTQRAAYDAAIGPKTVAKMWLDLLDGDEAGL